MPPLPGPTARFSLFHNHNRAVFTRYYPRPTSHYALWYLHSNTIIMLVRSHLAIRNHISDCHYPLLRQELDWLVPMAHATNEVIDTTCLPLLCWYRKILIGWK